MDKGFRKTFAERIFNADPSGRSLAGIAGSNPAEGMVGCPL
jgi:hypothetical protein